jgi:hypothetical protein
MKEEICLTTEMTPKIDTGGVAFSLRSRDYKDTQCVYDPSVHHGYKQFDNVCETVRARYGTGGKLHTLCCYERNK